MSDYYKLRYYKQPQPLHRLAVKAVGKSVPYNLIYKFVNSKPASWLESPSNVEKVAAWLRSYVGGQIPPSLHDVVCEEIIENQSLLIAQFPSIDITNCDESDISKAKAFATLCTAAHSSLFNLQCLRTSVMDRKVAEMFMGSMSLNSSLRELHVQPYHLPPDRVPAFVAALRHLPHLELLSLQSAATPEMLKVLAESCLQLRYIDLQAACWFTDTDVPLLYAMKRLSMVELDDTGVSALGYAQLFLHMPRLCYMGQEGYTIRDALDRVGAAYRDQRLPQSNLQYFNDFSTEMTADTLALLVEMCPHIVDLTMKLGRCDLSSLRKLYNLKQVAFVSCDYVGGRIQSALRAIGPNLHSLTLVSVTTLTVRALWEINKYCDNLRHLRIEKMPDDPLPVDVHAPPVRPFHKLRVLNIKTTYYDEHVLLWLLSACVNLECLSLYLPTRDATDAILHALWKVNKMPELERSSFELFKYRPPIPYFKFGVWAKF